MFKNKKGMELPITAIIVLIISITFLGLMIYFIKTALTKGTGGVETQFALLSDQEKTAVEQQGKTITFTFGSDLEVKKGTKQDSKVYVKNNYFNRDGRTVCHALRIKCLQAMSEGNFCSVTTGKDGGIVAGYSELSGDEKGDTWFTLFPTKKIDIPNNEYISQKVTVQINNAKADTYNMEAELLVAKNKLDCANMDDFENAGTERIMISVK